MHTVQIKTILISDANIGVHKICKPMNAMLIACFSTAYHTVPPFHQQQRIIYLGSDVNVLILL